MKHTALSSPSGQRWQWLVSALLLSIVAPLSAAEPVVGMTATVNQPVHPVLIRNEHSPLMRVVIELTENQDAVFQGLTVSLAGTDDPSDLESLTLYFTQDQEPFSPAHPVGEAKPPAETIAFRGERPG